MRRAEWIEAALIVAVAAASRLVWPLIPGTMPVWQIVLGLSALLLAQSLVRDVAILFRRRRQTLNQPLREAQCFCLESTVGATGVVAGAALAGLGNSNRIATSGWEFSIAVLGILALGFVIKDLVTYLKPFSLRREKDHLNLIVRWKVKSKS